MTQEFCFLVFSFVLVTFGLAWPIVKNFAVFNGVPYYSKDPAFYYWLDQTQAPLKKA